MKKRKIYFGTGKYMAKKYYAVKKEEIQESLRHGMNVKSRSADFREPLIKVLQAGKRLWIL